MSFVRVNPGGWAVGSQLTSAQQNQLDIDHANALDASTAGGTILGPVGFSGAFGQLTAVGSANIVASGLYAIQSTVAGGIRSSATGGITLMGGVLDYPTFSPPRTRSVSYALVPAAVPSGWTAGAAPGGASLQANATNNSLTVLLPVMHDGATLSTVSVILSVTTGHGAVPANLPTLQVQRVLLGSFGNTLPITQDLSTTPVQSFTPTPGSGSAWVNSNKTQSLNYTCNQNNVISTAVYGYVAYITDENGANSQAGNFYLGITLSYTAINDMRFP